MACLLKQMPGVNAVTSTSHTAVEICSAEGKLFYIGEVIEKAFGRSTGAKALGFPSDIYVDTASPGISSVSEDLMLGSHPIENADLKRIFLKCASAELTMGSG